MASRKQGGKKTSQSTSRRPSRVKQRAVTRPVRSPKQALAYWVREIGNYNPFVVKVDWKDGDLLAFHIWHVEEQELMPGQYEVDLSDGARVWGDLPSTAQFIENDVKARYGLIFFTEAWLLENCVSAAAGGGGKWPKSISL